MRSPRVPRRREARCDQNFEPSDNRVELEGNFVEPTDEVHSVYLEGRIVESRLDEALLHEAHAVERGGGP